VSDQTLSVLHQANITTPSIEFKGNLVYGI